MKRFLIGIDDTDNKTSRGTGFLARKMASEIERQGLGKASGITRHQLFFDPRIPYTSQNSSACLDILTNNITGLTDFVRTFLLKEAAEGSDVGLAVAEYDERLEDIVNWGQRAKEEVLSQNEAIRLAEENGILLEGLTGSRDGIIGALAGVGLRISGNDGRFIWLEGREIREMRGVYRVKDLLDEISVDQIEEKSGYLIPENCSIEIGNWLRPVLKNNKVTIIAEKSINNQDYEWEVASKEYIKSITG